MARYNDAVCRLCRRNGEKLFLKGERCFTPKCAMERRPNPPGQRSPRRRRVSDRGLQLREKQKARQTYGLLERQFRRVYKGAARRTGATGEILLQMLEMRLDNAVYRAGLAESRAQARQIVRHGHISLNGHKADIPSIELSVGDKFGWTERGSRSKFFEMVKQWQGARPVPGWIHVDPASLEGEVMAPPARDEIDARFDENLIIEYYSR
ncbi:MAG: 30S ribosomal protein S4 [Chloroflexi bacterium]|jgi:small subunit ribosomal protein S4|nr:30S ribosomal protein S4 [Chloroflexota bacterium]